MLTKMLEDESALHSAMRKNLQQRANKQSIPDCPVFQPTAEQWRADPLAYIHSLADAGEEAGLLKIIIPPECRPHDAVVLPDTYPFETKRQELSVLQDGQPFDDGALFSQTQYAAYATQLRAQWESQYPHHAARMAQAQQEGGDAAVVAVMEDVYWSMVERTSEDMHTVEYASDIDTGRYVCMCMYMFVHVRVGSTRQSHPCRFSSQHPSLPTGCTTTSPPLYATSPLARVLC